MATQTGSYDFKAAKAAHDEAAKTASDYITEITNDGIMVHAEGEGPDDTQTPTGWHISNVLEFIRQGVSRFWIGLKNSDDTTPTVRIGKDSGESRMELDYHSMQLVDKEGGTYFHVSDFRDVDGYATLVQNFDFKPLVTSIDQVELAMVASSISYVKLINAVVDPSSYSTTESSGHTVITFNPPLARPSGPPPSSGIVNAIQVEYKTDRDDYKCFTFGSRSSYGYLGPLSATFGDSHHAESLYSFASGHACNVTGVCSGAIGEFARAWGDCSVAFGYDVTANGLQSVAQNLGTKAGSPCQTALGKYNKEDANGTYAVIIGNGTSDDDRSNALRVTWGGSVEMGPHLTLEADSNNFASLSLASENRTGDFVKLYGASDANGDGVVVGDGGLVIVGSGESGTNLYSNLVTNGTWNPGTENTVIGADGDIYFYANAQDVATNPTKVRRLIYDANGNLNLRNATVVDGSTQTNVNSGYAVVDEWVDLKQTDNGVSASAWPTCARVADKNGYNIGQMAASVHPNGGTAMGLYAYNRDSSGTQTGINSLLVQIDKSGNQTYWVSNPQAFRNAIGIAAYGSLTGMSGDVDLSGTAASSAKKIPFATFSGLYCSANNGGIKVAQAGVYMIWATPYFTTGITQNDLVHALIYKNSSAVYDHHQRIGTYEQVNVGPIIQTLAANDTIYVYAYNQAAARGKVGNVWNGGLFVKRIA